MKLLPCPFCGGDALLQTPGVLAFVECQGCGCSTWVFDSREKAIAAWNRRVDTAEVA